MKKILLLLAVLFFGVYFADAQTITDDNDFQSWNDFQLTVPLGKNFDYFNKLTMRFGQNVSRVNDGRFAVGIVWKPTKSISVAPFYWYINARNARSGFRTENRLNLQASYRFPFKTFGLTHRSTYEYRYRGAGNSWRYRAALNFDRDLPKKFIPKAKYFFGDEVFYDSATGRFSRNRFSVGITKTVNKHLAVDIYLMRQNDGFSHPGDITAVWTAWKFRL